MAPPIVVMRLGFPLMLLAVVLVSGTIGWALSQGSAPARAPIARRAHRPAGPPQLPNGWNYIAVANSRTLAVYRSAGASQPFSTLSRRLSAGSPLSLLVHRTRRRWYEVYLPVRPDGAKAWVRASDVKLLTTAYWLVVQLHSHRLVLDISGRFSRSFSIGVGQSVTPTPTGTYFITELLKQPDPNGLYGPYAFGLSAYSGVLRHFGQGGNGQIGIHGTNEPQLVGTDVSHGCIRLRNPDIIWLTRRLPLGTPVVIEHT